MGRPAFRFIDDNDPVTEDQRFWRDVEASDRLGSAEQADAYLRALCRMRSIDQVGPASSVGDDQARQDRETLLLDAVRARGFLLGPDSRAESNNPEIDITGFGPTRPMSRAAHAAGVLGFGSVGRRA